MSEGFLIAIIDDDESVRSALATLVASFGYGLRAYDSAAGFLASDLVGSCHCVISDISMPGMSGFELTRYLRLKGDSTPVILITARCGPTIIAQAEASGAQSLLKKPFGAKQLIESLKRALGSGLKEHFC